MRLFLARHGETEWNAEHRLQGQTDTRLTPRGEAHAEALSQLLADEPLAAIYTSTLRRTIDTARPLADRRGLVSIPRLELIEMSYGVLEGHRSGDPDPVRAALWAARKQDPLRFKPPGGETYAELARRVGPFADELRRRHERDTVLVVGHRATNRVLLASLLEMPLAEALAFKHKHDVVLEIRPGMDPAVFEHRHAPITAR